MFLGALAALAGWIALSLLWTGSVPRTVLENERVLVYLAAGLAGVLLARRASVSMLLLGTWAAIAIVSTYGLATRLFPDQLGRFDPIASYRLSNPVGYWNAFGILAAIGTLLALGPRRSHRTAGALPRRGIERRLHARRSTSRTAGGAGSRSSQGLPSRSRSIGGGCS